MSTITEPMWRRAATIVDRIGVLDQAAALLCDNDAIRHQRSLLLRELHETIYAIDERPIEGYIAEECLHAA